MTTKQQGEVDIEGRRSRTSNRAVMSAPRCPISPVFLGLFAVFLCVLFTFVHAVSLVNHWSAIVAKWGITWFKAACGGPRKLINRPAIPSVWTGRSTLNKCPLFFGFRT